jgi:hypothetical protein
LYRILPTVAPLPKCTLYTKLRTMAEMWFIQGLGNCTVAPQLCAG